MFVRLNPVYSPKLKNSCNSIVLIILWDATITQKGCSKFIKDDKDFLFATILIK